MRPDEEQRPSLQSSPGFCFNQRCLTDIYQVRESRHDHGRNYTTEYFWGDSANTISYSNVRGMDHTEHMDTWLILIPYLISNCQTQAFYEVVRDKMQRLAKSQENSDKMYARLRSSFAVQVRTSMDIGSSQVAPAPREGASKKKKADIENEIVASAPLVFSEHGGRAVRHMALEAEEGARLAIDLSPELATRGARPGGLEKVETVFGHTVAAGRSPRSNQGGERGDRGDRASRQGSSVQLSHESFTASSLEMRKRVMDRRRPSLSESEDSRRQLGGKLAGSGSGSPLSPKSGGRRRSIVSDDGSSMFDYQYESETDEGSARTSIKSEGEHYQARAVSMALATPPRKRGAAGNGFGGVGSGESSNGGGMNGNEDEDEDEDEDPGTPEFLGRVFGSEHGRDEVSLLSTNSLKAGSIDLSTRSVHSDHKSIASDVQAPEALVLDDLKSEQDIRISELSRALNIHREDASNMLAYFNWDESRVMEAWESPTKMPEVRSFCV